APASRVLPFEFRPQSLTALRAGARAAVLEVTLMSEAALAIARDRDDARCEPRWVRALLIGLSIVFLTVFIVLPLTIVFAEAFAKGGQVYFAALAEPEAVSAIKLTLTVAPISVGLNLVFGLIAAWAVAKFEF